MLAIPILIFGWQAFNRPTFFQPLGLTIPLLLLTAITAVSIFYSAVDGRLAAIILARLLISLLLYFSLKSSWLTFNSIFSAFLIFFAVQGIAAIIQYWTQDDLGLQWLGELDLAPEPGRGSIIFGQGEYWLRSYGLAPHPNILGGLVGSALLIVCFSRNHVCPPWFSWLAPIGIFFGAMGLCFTFSRSAWLGTAVGLLFGLFLKFLSDLLASSTEQKTFQSRIQHFIKVAILQLAPLALAVAVFIPAARGPLQARSQPQESQVVTQSVGERQILIDVAFDLIGDSFPWGVGAGNFGPAMLLHPDKETFPNIHPVHNLPMLLTAELGLLGGATWVWLMLFPAGYGLIALIRRPDALTAPMIGLIAALLVLATVDLLDYYSWGWPHGLTWRWMLFALLGKACADQTSSSLH
ncbi:MAG: O-antigen ligase family protein [Anaerolineae bacterium]